MMRERRFAWLAIGILVAAPLALFGPILLSHRMLWGFDVELLGIPLRAELERSLAAFEWPLWMPGVLGGMPLLASSNLQFIYPTDFFGCVSGLSIQALTLVDAIIHVALSGIGMYLFLRRLDRGQAASLLGAFFFSLSGTQVSQVYGGFYSFVQAIAMLPWAFWAAHKAWREGSWFAWGLCGLALGLQILSASFQLFCYTAAAVTAFVLFLALEDRARMRAQAGSGRGAGAGPAAAVAGLALAALFAVFLSAPLLWLQIQYQPLCARHAYGYAKFIEGSISLKESLSWLVPGFFGWHWPSYHGALGDCFTSEYFGLLPWGLACAALAALWRREARVRWMAGLALCAWLIAQRQWTPFPYLFIHLPVVSGFRIWSRVLLLLTFAVCTLAAFGWDVLWNPLEPQCRRRGAWGLAAWSALGLLAAALAWAFADAGASAATAAHAALIRLYGGLPQALEQLGSMARDSALRCAALSALLGAAALAFLLPFGPGLARRGPRWFGPGLILAAALAFQAFDQSSVWQRFITTVDTREAESFGATEPEPGLPQPPGLEPWRVFDDEAHAFRLNRSLVLGYENLNGYGSMPLRSTLSIMDAMGKRRQDWLDLMDVRYIFTHPASAPGDAIQARNNPGALPRAWLLTRVRKVSSDEEAYQLLADPGFDPRIEAALDVDTGLKGLPVKGRVQWLARTPQSRRLQVDSSGDAVLMLADNWYPSWRCRVDGQAAPLLKADGGLQAVLLKAGSHQVEFRFDPALFEAALAASLAALLALAGLGWAQARRHWRGGQA